MDYIIVRDTLFPTKTNEYLYSIKQKLINGWQPLGGPNIDNTNRLIYQAFVKPIRLTAAAADEPPQLKSKSQSLHKSTTKTKHGGYKKQHSPRRNSKRYSKKHTFSRFRK